MIIVKYEDQEHPFYPARVLKCDRKQRKILVEWWDVIEGGEYPHGPWGVSQQWTADKSHKVPLTSWIDSDTVLVRHADMEEDAEHRPTKISAATQRELTGADSEIAGVLKRKKKKKNT